MRDEINFIDLRCITTEQGKTVATDFLFVSPGPLLMLRTESPLFESVRVKVKLQ